MFIYFNPRSHERSDYDQDMYNEQSVNFNPRSHERSDSATDFIELGDYISIHAPTRGATVLLMMIYLLMIFQSTLPREERHGSFTPDGNVNEFQSTLPREERLSTVILTSPSQNISIHAPTRGATEAHLPERQL